jgi:hypothetical protein
MSGTRCKRDETVRRKAAARRYKQETSAAGKSRRIPAAILEGALHPRRSESGYQPPGYPSLSSLIAATKTGNKNARLASASLDCGSCQA